MGGISSLLREDLDKLLSYNTKQEVNILDRHLGISYYLIMLSILVYVIGYDLYWNQGYFVYEKARGIIATQNAGDVYMVSSGKPGHRYFSADEIGYPNLENGNRFVATKVTVHKQSRGVCEDKWMPCADDSDCSKHVNGECQDSGFCLEPSWCESSPPEIYELPTDSHLIWVKSAIQFIQLDKHKLFLSDMVEPRKYPSTKWNARKDFSDYNTFSVRDILSKCEPPVRYEEISELGAAIEVQVIYNCNIADEKCKPKYQARRLDHIFDLKDIGFGFQMARYQTQDHNMRELLNVRGVRIYFRTVGTGRKMSYIALVMRLSTGLALLATARIFSDFLMLNVFQFRDKYYARKYIESPDFSDLFKEMHDREEKARQESLQQELQKNVQALMMGGKDDKKQTDQDEEDEERLWRRRIEEDDV